MADAYQRITDVSGRLKPADEHTQKEAAEAFEIIEQLYGMIWVLAHQSVAGHISLDALRSLEFSRESIKDVVQFARIHYQDGFHVSQVVNRLPNQRRDE